MTMSLFEAIEHAEQKAKDENCCCRDDHAQLAEWLKELAIRRSISHQLMDNNPSSRLMFGDFSSVFDNVKNYSGSYIDSGCVNASQKTSYCVNTIQKTLKGVY